MVDVFLLLSAAVIFVVGSDKPDRLFLLWLALSPLSKDTLVLFGVDLRVVSFDRLMLVASVVGLIASGEFHKLFPARFSKLEKAMVWFLVIFLIEALVTFRPRDAFSMWTRCLDSFGIPFYLYLLAKYLLTRDATTYDELEGRLGRVLIYVGLYCAAMGVFEAVTHIDILPSGRGELEMVLDRPRVNGPFGPPEVLGLYLSLIFLFSLYRWNVGAWATVGSRGFKKVLRAAYTLLLLAGIYSTMFRNVWGGCLGGYLSRYWFSRKGRGLCLLAAAVLILISMLNWGEITKSGLYSERLTNTENIYDRLGAWLYSFRAFSEHPLVGIGYGQIKHYIYAAQSAGDDLRVMDVPATYHPHNTAIAMLAENGILLTVPLFLVIWYFLGHVRGCIHLARSYSDREFGLFAVGGLIAMFAPHVSDRCLAWDKYNNLLLVFFALVAARHAMLEGVVSSPALHDESP